MHRLKVSLLCLLSLSLAVSAFAQDTTGVATLDSSGVDTTGVYSYSGGVAPGAGYGTYFNARYMSGNGVGYDQGYFQLGGFIPFWMGENALIAPDVRLMLGNNSTVGGNVGLVGRKYFEGADRIVGAAAYLDMDQSAFRNTYTQGTFGLETLGQFWDLRANYYYVPGTQDNFVSNGVPLCVSGNPFFSGNNIVFQGQRAVLREQAMDGVDFEFGMPVTQSTPWLRAYAGAYYYRASQVQPPPIDVAIPNTTDANPWGFRARLDAWVADDLLLGVNVTTDSVWGTNVNGVVDFRFSGFKPTRYFPQWTTRERMLAPWQRNWRIAVEQYGTAENTTIAAINPATGNPYFVSFIDNANPNPGTGTFENPYNSFNFPNGIPNADIIIVERGTSTLANPYLGTMKLYDNQRLLGEGSSIAPLNLSATFGQCSVNGNFALPFLDGSGNYPFISNPGAGPAITLANNNEVAGFNIVNGGGDGIFADVNNFNLHDLEIRGQAGIGIHLLEATGTGTLTNINVGSTNLPNPTGIGNNAGGGVLITSGATPLNLTMTNVFMNSNPAGTQPFGISLGAYNGSMTATMNNVHADGNVNGIVLAEVNQTLTATMNGVTANGNTNDGIQVLASGGTVTANLNVVQTNGNGEDGLGLYGVLGAVINDNIINSQLNGNGRDGIHKELTGGSTNNEFIDPTLIIGNGRDGIYYSLVDSTMNEAVVNNNFSGNSRSAFYGLMNNSTATFNIQNLTATNSGADGFSLVATNGSTVNATVTNTAFSNSTGNGMAIALNDSTGTFTMTGVSSNSNIQNGVAFRADAGSTFTMTALSSAFNGNFVNGFVGEVLNGSQANLSTGNGSSISGNTLNGVYVATSGLSNIAASFANTAINNNANGNGIRLSIDNSPNSSLTLSGTTSLNANGVNGLLVDAVNNTTYTQTLTGTNINNNTQDGIHLNVVSGSTVTGTLTNVNATANGGNGIDIAVVGANSSANLTGTNLNGASNTQTNLNVLVANGGFLNFGVTGGSFSDSVNGAGVQAIVTDVNSTAYLDFNTVSIDNNAGQGFVGLVTAPAPGVGQTGASLNVCLDNSSLSSNTLQGISVVSLGDGATASFGVGTLTPGSASFVNNNGHEGVLANAIAGGTINFRQIGSHFDGNGTAVVSDGLNFGGNDGVIRTLMYGGSADGNSGNGLRVGPISPNVSTFGSDLTVSLANGFSGSNNGLYGLNFDGSGANSANLLQDPGTPAPVFVGNGAGAQNVNFAGANQVVLQEVGSFNGSGGDGASFVFSNINTAIISFNGLGTGTISGNAGNGLFVQMNNVKNGSILVTGYTDISNNGLDGLHFEMNGNSPATPMNAAIEIDGVAGNTNMASNGHNGVNILLNNATMVNNFASLPGVSLTVLTPTDNDSLNSCIPAPLSLAGGLAGLTPATALNIHNLNVTGSGATGGTGGIMVAGANTTFENNGGSISNNIVSGSTNGGGIGVFINETVAPTTAIANGFSINNNVVSGNSGTGIAFNVTNAAVINVPTADNLHINGNTVTGNTAGGINVTVTNPNGSTSTANGMQLMSNTVLNNTGNGVTVDIDSLTVNGINLSNTAISGSTGNGLFLNLNRSTMTGLVANTFTSNDNDLNGWAVLLQNASTFSGANVSNSSIQRNGLDGVNVDATDGTASTFGTALNPIVFNSSVIADNAQNFVADGLRLRLYGGSTANMQFNATQIGNTNPAATQEYGMDFILGSGAFPGGSLTASFNGGSISGNNVDGIVGLINGTGVAGGSVATVSLSGTTVANNNAAGLDFAVNNTGNLGLIVSNSSLINANGSDGVHVDATGTGTLFNGFVLDSTISNNAMTGLGNGLTANMDNNARGALTVTNSFVGNSAPGGTQQNGLDLNVNQSVIGANSNMILTATNSSFSNNAVSGIAANITGAAGGPNPVNGLEATLDQTTVDTNGGNGIAINVSNGGLAAVTAQNLSSVSGNGANGFFVNASGPNTLSWFKIQDTLVNNNGSGIFPGDGFNGTAIGGARLNIEADTTGLGPVAFSGNAGDGIDVLVSDQFSRSDIDLHNVSAGADAVNGFLGNTLNGVKFQSLDGAEVNLRAYDTHFDGNGASGLLGVVTDSNGLDTVGRVRMIGGTADNNTGDGITLLGSNTAGGSGFGVATLTGQFQADDGGIGVSAQNNGGYGLNFIASNPIPPFGGVVGNLLMTGPSVLTGNGTGLVNVNMVGADQAIVGLSGTFNGSTNGDGINVSLSDISGLALVSLQGPGSVSNNAGNGINVSLSNINQGGVFIGGFSDVSNNGTANGAGGLGQDGIRVLMDNVTLGAVTINGETVAQPGNVMDVSNNTGNGVSVAVTGGSVIDNTTFNGVLGANLVTVIDYTPPDTAIPAPLPNPLLTTSAQNVSTILGIAFEPTLAIENLNIDNNGNATAGDLTGSGILLRVDGSTVVGQSTINNNTISNTGSGVAGNTHSGITVRFQNGAVVTGLDVLENSITGNRGDGFTMLQPYMTTTPFNLNFTRDTITNNSVNGVNIALPNLSLLNPTLNLAFTNTVVSNNTSNGVLLDLANTLNSDATANVSILSDSGTANPTSGLFTNQFNNNGGMGMFVTSTDFFATNTSSLDLTIGGTGAANQFNSNGDAGVGINLAGSATGTANVTNAIFSNNTHPGNHGPNFLGDGFAVFLRGTAAAPPAATFNNSTFDGVTFSNNAGSGFRLGTSLNGSSDNLQIINSTITGNTQNGITVLRNAGILTPGPYITNALFDNNTITNNQRGIDISSEFADGADQYTITNNTITNNRSHGINFFTQADADVVATIDSNNISSNQGDGIRGTQNLGATDVGIITGDATNNTIRLNSGNGINIVALHQWDIGGNGANQPNTISNNTLDGITLSGSSVVQVGVGPAATTALSQNSIIANAIRNNGGNGITINSFGVMSVNIADNNALSTVPGGGLGGIDDNGGDGVQLNAVSGLIVGTTVTNNDVFASGGDGIQLLVSGTGSDFFPNSVTITANGVEDSGARGINVLNASDSRTNLRIGGNALADANTITRSRLEGVYIVNTSTSGALGNTAGAVQGVDAIATTAMALGNTWLADPRLALTMGNNLITSNGQAANSGLFINSSGLVVRIGSSDGSNSFTDAGGFASTYTSGTLNDATVVTIGNMTRGGMVANVYGNTFGGNFASDATFQAFVSTNAPATTGGTWTDQNENPRNNGNDVFAPSGYFSDPLSRLDLRFTATNTGDGIIATRTDFGTYSNSEPIFKSRTGSQDNATDAPQNGSGPGDDGGPFNSATRARNITRQASNAAPFNQPNSVGSVVDVAVNGFLYPGVSTNSTFRRTADTTSAGFATPPGNDFTTVTPNGGLIGELGFKWDAF